jgi:hypothetical protein
MFTLLLVILIPFNRSCDEQVDEYIPPTFIFKALPVIVKSISTLIICNAVDL